MFCRDTVCMSQRQSCDLAPKRVSISHRREWTGDIHQSMWEVTWAHWDVDRATLNLSPHGSSHSCQEARGKEKEDSKGARSSVALQQTVAAHTAVLVLVFGVAV